MQPEKTGKTENPYDFILSSGQAPKKSKLSIAGPGSSKKRLLIALSVGLFLLIVILVFVSLVFGGDDKRDKLLSIVKQQQEIVRVSGLAAGKSRRAETTEFAINTGASVSTSRNDLVALLKKNGAKLKDKELVGSKNPKNDQVLTIAYQNNQFDETFVKLLQQELKVYQESILEASKGMNESDKKILTKAYSDANILLDQSMKKR